jgi:hypothetical protein
VLEAGAILARLDAIMAELAELRAEVAASRRRRRCWFAGSSTIDVDGGLRPA